MAVEKAQGMKLECHQHRFPSQRPETGDTQIHTSLFADVSSNMTWPKMASKFSTSNSTQEILTQIKQDKEDVIQCSYVFTSNENRKGKAHHVSSPVRDKQLHHKRALILQLCRKNTCTYIIYITYRLKVMVFRKELGFAWHPLSHHSRQWTRQRSCETALFASGYWVMHQK